MKLSTFLLALLVCFNLTAQKNELHNNVSINHSINDDGKKLDIKVKGTMDGKLIDYNHTFDVTGMDKEQRDAIKRSVYDSLGLPDPIQSPQEFHSGHGITSMTAPDASNGPRITSKDQFNEFHSVGGKHGYTKEIKYNIKTGILFMRYRFEKNGEPNSVEKSIDAKGKTKEERDEIIKAYEKEIGFKEQITV